MTEEYTVLGGLAKLKFADFPRTLEDASVLRDVVVAEDGRSITFRR